MIKINNLDKNVENVLTKLIKINSVNGNEKNMVDLITDLLKKYNPKYTVLNHGNNRASLVLEVLGEDNSDAIAFIGHIDTVPVGDIKTWKYDPFSAIKEDEYIYGRGSCDMKGGVCAMLLTAEYILKNKIKPFKKLYFCFTADEEANGLGILDIKKSNIIKDAKEIIICEPSLLKMGLCEKGALWLKVKVHGREAHASMPHLGINSIEVVNEFLERLRDSVDMQSRNKYLGKTTISITKIEGGVKTNMIPAYCEASIDIRTIPEIENEFLINTALKIAEQIKKEKKVLIKIEVENNRPALQMEENDPYVLKFKEVYDFLEYNYDKKGINFYTDASQIIPDYKIPFIILGPGDDSLAHQKDEKININSVSRAINIYVNYILNDD